MDPGLRLACRFTAPEELAHKIATCRGSTARAALLTSHSGMHSCTSNMQYCTTCLSSYALNGPW